MEPAVRVPRLVLDLVTGLDSGPGEPSSDADPERLHRTLRGIREFVGADLGDGPVMRALVTWSGLTGAVSLELFGHLANGVDDYDVWFAAMADRLAPT